jgi:hypothetical protein
VDGPHAQRGTQGLGEVRHRSWGQGFEVQECHDGSASEAVMLSTTCWVILYPNDLPHQDNRVYLREEDAWTALDALPQSDEWKLKQQVVERTLVLGFGMTDQRVASEEILARLTS